MERERDGYIISHWPDTQLPGKLEKHVARGTFTGFAISPLDVWIWAQKTRCGARSFRLSVVCHDRLEWIGRWDEGELQTNDLISSSISRCCRRRGHKLRWAIFGEHQIPLRCKSIHPILSEQVSISLRCTWPFRCAPLFSGSLLNSPMSSGFLAGEIALGMSMRSSLGENIYNLSLRQGPIFGYVFSRCRMAARGHTYYVLTMAFNQPGNYANASLRR